MFLFILDDTECIPNMDSIPIPDYFNHMLNRIIYLDLTQQFKHDQAAYMTFYDGNHLDINALENYIVQFETT